MNDILPAIIVCLITPVFIMGTAIYSMVRKEFFLGAFASCGFLFLSMTLVSRLLDQHLWSYTFIYMMLAPVSLVLLVCAIGRGTWFLGIKVKNSIDDHGATK